MKEIILCLGERDASVDGICPLHDNRERGSIKRKDSFCLYNLLLSV